jgi:hypothetical protein
MTQILAELVPKIKDLLSNSRASVVLHMIIASYRQQAEQKVLFSALNEALEEIHDSTSKDSDYNITTTLMSVASTPAAPKQKGGRVKRNAPGMMCAFWIVQQDSCLVIHSVNWYCIDNTLIPSMMLQYLFKFPRKIAQQVASRFVKMTHTHSLSHSVSVSSLTHSLSLTLCCFD